MTTALILILAAFAISAAHSLTTDFAPVREKKWVLYQPTITLQNVNSRFDCVAQCQETTDCVGGHWSPSSNATCRLMVNPIRRRVTYTWGQTLPGDYVFGTPCDVTSGYVKILRFYIVGQNDATYSTSSLHECIQKCNQFSWCRSADHHENNVCYLSARDQFSGHFKEGSDEDEHAERLC